MMHDPYFPLFLFICVVCAIGSTDQRVAVTANHLVHTISRDEIGKECSG